MSTSLLSLSRICRFLLVAAGFLIASCSSILAGADEPKKDGEHDFRKLVEGLASPNKPIKCLGDGAEEMLIVPPDYDWKAQEQIEENRKILYEHCEDALPFLIDACTNARYSMTAPWSEDGVESYSVGEICLKIIAAHVEVFRQSIRFRDPPHWYQYSFVPSMNAAIGQKLTDEKKKQIQEWWQSRKDKSLYLLQLDAFDWAIEKQTEELRQQPTSEKQRRDELAQNIKKLQEARDALFKAKKCHPPRRMWGSIRSTNRFKVVPWTEDEE